MNLAEFHLEHYQLCLRWLAHCLERLGKDISVELWCETFPENQRDELLENILDNGWEAVSCDRIDIEKSIRSSLERVFPRAFEDVDADLARQLVDRMLPFSVMRTRLQDLNVVRDTSSFDAFHLHYHGLALLAENLIKKFGRRGELIAYDANLLTAVLDQNSRLPSDEYLLRKYDRFKIGFDQPDINTAALDRELIRSSATELVWKVKQCEWARYFRKHHPRVGSLLACSKDHAEYGSYNKNIRLQLTSTIM